MPNDTLDEIWARWERGDEGPPPDIRTLIEMVRARDAEIKFLHETIDCLEWPKAKHDAALGTPPAQEPTENV